MRRLFVCIIVIFILIVLNYKKENEYYFKNLKSDNLTDEQEKNLKEKKDNLIQEYNEIKEQLFDIRRDIQIEMRKDTPDWDKINMLSDEEIKLQEFLEKEISEYKKKIKMSTN